MNQETWGDVAARVFLAASLISASIPTVFFTVVTHIEMNLVQKTLLDYFISKCALLRAWLPPQATQDRGGGQVTQPPPNPAAKQDKQEAVVTYYAYATSLLISALFLCLALWAWFVFGRLPLSSIVASACVYLGVFGVTEVGFILAISQAPVFETDRLNKVVITELARHVRDCA